MQVSQQERQHIADIVDTLQERKSRNVYIPTSRFSKFVDFTHSEAGHTFTGVVEVEPGEAQSLDLPGFPAQSTVVEIFINGHEDDCADLLNPSLIMRIAADVVAQWEGAQ